MRANQFLHGPLTDAHSNMAANIDQIFQEFILNKIREIEVQNEDKTYVTTVLDIRDARCGLRLFSSRI